MTEPYRVVKTVYRPNEDGSEDASYGIHNMEYDDDGNLMFDDAYGTFRGGGGTMDELLGSVRALLTAITHPVLISVDSVDRREVPFSYKEAAGAVPAHILERVKALIEVLPESSDE